MWFRNDFMPQNSFSAKILPMSKYSDKRKEKDFSFGLMEKSETFVNYRNKTLFGFLNVRL